MQYHSFFIVIFFYYQRVNRKWKVIQESFTFWLILIWRESMSSIEKRFHLLYLHGTPSLIHYTYQNSGNNKLLSSFAKKVSANSPGITPQKTIEWEVRHLFTLQDKKVKISQYVLAINWCHIILNICVTLPDKYSGVAELTRNICQELTSIFNIFRIRDNKLLPKFEYRCSQLNSFNGLIHLFNFRRMHILEYDIFYSNKTADH